MPGDEIKVVGDVRPFGKGRDYMLHFLNRDSWQTSQDHSCEGELPSGAGLGLSSSPGPDVVIGGPARSDPVTGEIPETVGTIPAWAWDTGDYSDSVAMVCFIERTPSQDEPLRRPYEGFVTKSDTFEIPEPSAPGTASSADEDCLSGAEDPEACSRISSSDADYATDVPEGDNTVVEATSESAASPLADNEPDEKFVDDRTFPANEARDLPGYVRSGHRTRYYIVHDSDPSFAYYRWLIKGEAQAKTGRCITRVQVKAKTDQPGVEILDHSPTLEEKDLPSGRRIDWSVSANANSGLSQTFSGYFTTPHPELWSHPLFDIVGRKWFAYSLLSGGTNLPSGVQLHIQAAITYKVPQGAPSGMRPSISVNTKRC